MRLYKLTDENGQTYNQTQWGEGVTHTASGKGPLGSKGWLHAYTDPYLAVILNPIHAKFSHPLLWEVEGEVGKDDHGLKVGCTKLTTIKQIPLPVITTKQKIVFAILCAKSVCSAATWNKWADAWLAGDRRAVTDADDAAYYVACVAAGGANAAASAAAAAAAYVFRDDNAVDDDAVVSAAYAAAYAAGIKNLDFDSIIKQTLDWQSAPRRRHSNPRITE